MHKILDQPETEMHEPPQEEELLELLAAPLQTGFS